MNSIVGAGVGSGDGLRLCRVGLTVGSDDGCTVGSDDCCAVGTDDGCAVGSPALVGCKVGFNVGFSVGCFTVGN